MKVDSVKSPAFCALPVSEAAVKGFKSKYRLYEAGVKDKPFLENLCEKVNLRNLMPNLNDIEFHAWNTIFRHSVVIPDDMYKVFVETCDNVPCGVLNYIKTRKLFHINYLVTFPDRFMHRVPCAGQVLFNELLRRFLKSDVDKIELTAIRKSPFNAVDWYRKLGFFPVCGDTMSDYMRLWRDNAVKTFNSQNEFISVNPIKSAKEIDLNKIVRYCE